ncbi:unnamed protein product [Soboliphyme baturini]|uniref:Tubulin domain-containing protein n=1 Tax=Soboliphyme baturini TaxID=241478 RepID=A0A183ICS9_9BILA|nr:unnamed protein product [Soboliphyme baturini]
MSMIGGNDPFDMYRHYIFRPASKECTETSCHQTAGIQFYVTDNRVILLDTQPVLSSSALDYLLQNDRRYSYDWSTFENHVEIESLQIAAFLFQVCHVVIVLFDWFLDVSLINFLYTAEMLKPSMHLSEGPVNVDYYPHLSECFAF